MSLPCSQRLEEGVGSPWSWSSRWLLGPLQEQQILFSQPGPGDFRMLRTFKQGSLVLHKAIELQALPFRCGHLWGCCLVTTALTQGSSAFCRLPRFPSVSSLFHSAQSFPESPCTSAMSLSVAEWHPMVWACALSLFTCG